MKTSVSVFWRNGCRERGWSHCQSWCMWHVGELTFCSSFTRLHFPFWNWLFPVDFFSYFALAQVDVCTMLLVLHTKNFKPEISLWVPPPPWFRQSCDTFSGIHLQCSLKTKQAKSPKHSTWIHSPYNILEKISSPLFTPLFFFDHILHGLHSM